MERIAALLLRDAFVLLEPLLRSGNIYTLERSKSFSFGKSP